jgi:hypothetical protein
MIPNQMRADRFVKNLINGTESIKILDIDLFAPVEGLDCQTVADYIILNPDLMFKFLKNTRTPSSTTILSQLLDQMQPENKLKLSETLKSCNYIREPKSIILNLFLTSPILRCFEMDLDQTYSICEMMINWVMDSEKSLDSYNLLIQIMPNVLGCMSEFSWASYQKFFFE